MHCARITISRRFCLAIFVGVVAARGSWVGCSALAASPLPLDFPVVIQAGDARAASTDGPGGAQRLPDLPFSTRRGYGYIGGTVRQLGPTRVFGLSDHGHGPLRWRDGVEKYSFRVPRGDYLVELSFIETDVDAPGLRVFDVRAEGQELFPKVDIVALGGDFTWVTLADWVSVYDGWLDLRFSGTTAFGPRVARIRLNRREDLPAESEYQLPQSPVGEAVGAPDCVVLRWKPLERVGVAGYGVFRAESRDGPFLSLVDSPILTDRFIDYSVSARQKYYYKLRAYSLQGGQSPLSPPMEATPIRIHRLSLPVYNLRIQPQELRRLASRDAESAEVAGELVHLGSTYYVKVRIDTSPERWQRKKSFMIELDSDRNRFFQRRNRLYLSAEADDFSFLRERLSAAVQQALELATPTVKAVLLLLNGRFHGLYHDRERIDGRFRRRVRLDRVGALVRPNRGDNLAMDWKPYGDKIGKAGNLFGMTKLVHELNRVNEGEMVRYFDNRLYLDRYLTRAALSIVSGESGHWLRDWLILEDSRNHKLEIFREEHRSGQWGLASFSRSIEALTPERARQAFLRYALHGRDIRGHWSVLETRFWNQPFLRQQLIERVERLLSDELPPAVFDRLVDESVADVKAWVSVDPWSDEVDLPAIAAALKKEHRHRVKVIRGALAAESKRRPSALQISEFLARPASGAPWVELHNGSSEAMSLASYFLTDDVLGKRRLPLGNKVVAAGARILVRLPLNGSVRLRSAGGFLAVLHDSRGRTELSDVVFYGHQTRSVSYGRVAVSAGGAWEFLAAPSPDAANGSELRRPPPYAFLNGVEPEKNRNAFILWIRPRVTHPDKEQAPSRVFLRYSEQATGDEFQEVELSYDESQFRYTFRYVRSETHEQFRYYYLAVSADGVERSYPLPAPDLTLSIPRSVGIQINEVLPRPLRTPDSPGEFIELYNPNDKAIDLEGLFLSDSRRNTTKWRIPAGNVIPAKGYAVFYADGLNRGKHTSFRLSNSGEFLGLFGRLEEGNLMVDRIAFRGTKAGLSWGRTQDGTKSFRSWKDPTPGARNMPKIPEEALRKLREQREKEEAERKRTGKTAPHEAPARKPSTKPPTKPPDGRAGNDG